MNNIIIAGFVFGFSQNRQKPASVFLKTLEKSKNKSGDKIALIKYIKARGSIVTNYCF